MYKAKKKWEDTTVRDVVLGYKTNKYPEVNTANDEEMIDNGLRRVRNPLDQSVFIKSDEEKQKVKQFKSQHKQFNSLNSLSTKKQIVNNLHVLKKQGINIKMNGLIKITGI